MKDILLLTINAKWIHPSLALRLLKANLGSLEDRCEIIELALRQSMGEKTAPFIECRARILGISVSIWNHIATIELLEELEKVWAARAESAPDYKKPVVILGGPEVSHLPPESELFKFADYVICGEGEAAFPVLCTRILGEAQPQKTERPQFISAAPVNLSEIKSGYHLYSDEDLAKKLIYVESSRGCPFNCEFCLSSVKSAEARAVREFPLEPFLAEMDELAGRGARVFKFLDRTFNFNIDRALRIIEFFLKKITESKTPPIMAHFEMVPSLFPGELLEALTRFPPNTLRLEIGIQTLNRETAALIGRVCNPEEELEVLHFLCEKTNAIVHADLIAGLPGEDLASFGAGFDRLWAALTAFYPRVEIQTGILKLLPGVPISRHSEKFGMHFSPAPPYEVVETASLSAGEVKRLKNFARFWELIVNRGMAELEAGKPVFSGFMALSDALLSHFGRNWGIDKNDLRDFLEYYDSWCFILH
ncbi:MAG: DUF4080 domain-containing protein [Treponema sp.]|nr:DUF4080 domain-containing protein [Treponema sp.]